jgi:hypothetical protein
MTLSLPATMSARAASTARFIAGVTSLALCSSIA